MADFYNDPMMPLARQLLDAGSNRERAGMLLRVPDAIILLQAEAMSEACRAAGFHSGADFITLRQTALHHVRDAHGVLPMGAAITLEAVRYHLSRFVGGAPL